jgi:MerR family transcriptional regulator, thiopeptide resistance regulator
MGLVREFTGGDPGIQQAVNRLYREEPSVQQRTGIDAAISDYIGRAIAVSKAD